MGRPQRSGFSGRNRGRCLRRFWHPWQFPLLPSVLRDEQWARLKGCRVANAVIEAMVAEVLSRLSTEAKLHLGLSDSLFGVVHGLAPHPDELVLQRVEDGEVS